MENSTQHRLFQDGNVVINFSRQAKNLSFNTFYVIKGRKGVLKAIYKLKCVIFCTRKRREILKPREIHLNLSVATLFLTTKKRRKNFLMGQVINTQHNKETW